MTNAVQKIRCTANDRGISTCTKYVSVLSRQDKEQGPLKLVEVTEGLSLNCPEKALPHSAVAALTTSNSFGFSATRGFPRNASTLHVDTQKPALCYIPASVVRASEFELASFVCAS